MNSMSSLSHGHTREVLHRFFHGEMDGNTISLNCYASLLTSRTSHLCVVPVSIQKTILVFFSS